MDAADALKLARRVAPTVCFRSSPWFDDVVQAAAIGALDAPPGAERAAAWRRGVDELRRLTRFHPSRGAARVVVSLDAYPSDWEVPVEDFHPSDHRDALTDREQFVVDGLVAGATLAEIGRALGVTESRVCQIREGIARRLRRVAA